MSSAHAHTPLDASHRTGRSGRTLLKFTNAQLLELRFYDALVDRELPGGYDQMEKARRRCFKIRFGGRYTALLGRIHAFYADTTEVVERIEDALKGQTTSTSRVYRAARSTTSAGAPGGVESTANCASFAKRTRCSIPWPRRRAHIYSR